MTQGSELADRLIGRVFGGKEPEAEAPSKPHPPQSVIARLEEGRKHRRRQRGAMRDMKRRLF